MKKSGILFIFMITLLTANAQITPAGFDNTKFVSWQAFGVKQTLDTLNKKSILVYLGGGLESRLDDLNLFERPGIFVSDQRFQHKFHANWKYNIGLSYRKQHHYSSEFPYDHESPSIVNEIRTYSTIAYSNSIKKMTWELAFKEEFRTFFTKEQIKPKYPINLRSRLKLKLKWNLDDRKKHGIIFQAESLFSIGRENTVNHLWSQFKYSDSRLSLFYTYSPKNIPFNFEFGYMNELRGIKNKEDINFLAFNIIWINPFNLNN